MKDFDLDKLKKDIALRKGMPDFGPNTSIERLRIINATMGSFTPDVVEGLIDQLESADALINQYSAENTKMGNDIMRKIVAETAMRQRILQLESLERANAAQDDHINQQQDRIDSLEKTNAELGKALCKARAELKRRDDAEPVAWQFLADNGKWLYIIDPAQAERYGCTVRPLYTTTPAAALPPEMSETDAVEFVVANGPYSKSEAVQMAWSACRDAAKALSCQSAEALPSARDSVRTEHAEWSLATFGDVGPVGPLKHLSKEALEAAAEPSDLSEWADMQFLLWDAQRRAGITDEQITTAMIEKLAVNKMRQWSEPKDGEPRLHIKDTVGMKWVEGE